MDNSFVKIRVHGDGLSHKVIDINNDNIPIFIKVPIKSQQGIINHKNWQRRVTRILNGFHSIKSIPTVFITLVLPLELHISDETKHFKDCFMKFKRYLRTAFKKSWFLYKYEWGPKMKLHVHMIGTFRIKDEALKLERAGKKLEIKWSKLLAGKHSPIIDKAYKQDRFSEKRNIAYITTSQKKKRDIKCSKILQNSHTWGYINKKNIRFHEPRQYVLSSAEFKTLREKVVEYAETHTNSNYAQKSFTRKKSTINGIDNAFLKQTIREIYISRKKKLKKCA